MKNRLAGTVFHIFSIWVVLALLLTPGMAITVFAAPGDLTRVSVSSAGVQADAMSYSGEISANGRFVVFDSEAGNLVVDDTNGLGDVFLRDRQLGTTIRVSVDANGGQVGGGGDPDISADGRFIAFDSGATTLVSGDTNGFSDIFVKDTQTGAVTRVTVDSSDVQANNDSTSPSISGDGRYVAFVSAASNLVPNDTNGVSDVFVHDLQTGTTIRASVNANGSSFESSISLDGRFVVFTSGATNLVADDTNEKRDVFVYMVQTGQIVRASVNSSGVQADKGGFDPSISGDGRYVTFSSAAENLMTQDTFGFQYVYVHDFVTGSTDIVTINHGFPMIGWSDSSKISADGRYIAFSYDDKGDGLAVRWIYVHDRVSKINILPTSGSDTNAPIFPSISGDGKFLVYASSGPLVSDDTNGMRDIFIKEIAYPPDLNPTVKYVTPSCSNGCGAADPVVDFAAVFSEPVSGVDASDFVLTVSGGISGAAITGVREDGDDHYIVTVNTGSGDGKIRLDVVDDDSIKDFPLNPLGGVGLGNGNSIGEEHVVNKNLPVVAGITRMDANPSVQSSVRFAVNFSEPVSDVDASDFSVAVTGQIAGANITEVTGSGASYVVLINTGTGDGTLRLDVIDDDSIVDAAISSLGGSGTGNGNFTSGESYTFERSVPSVSSIIRMDANPSSAQSVSYRVTFSESVTGVDINDFVLNQSGISGASLIAVNGSGNTYAITVGTGSGSGTLRLDLIDNDGILDSGNNSLGGVGAGNGNFTTGETYNINKTTVTYSSETFRSGGSNDGWVLESNENSNVGGSVNATAKVFNLGDNAQDAQYRAILHFPTQSLPDNAVVTRVILTIKKQGLAGTDPFATHQNIQIDIATGNFGFDSYLGSLALQPLDFQAPSTLDAVGTIQNNPVGGVYWSLLNGDANRFINLKGVTQLRLLFQLDDNDDLGDDFIKFYSGDATELTDRPHLQIEYYVTR